MKNKSITISYNTILTLVFANLFLILITIAAIIYDWSFFQIYAIAGFVFLFTAWLIVFSDMVKHRVHNKVFWVSSMFIMPIIAILFYLYSREKLIRLGQRSEI